MRFILTILALFSVSYAVTISHDSAFYDTKGVKAPGFYGPGHGLADTAKDAGLWSGHAWPPPASDSVNKSHIADSVKLRQFDSLSVLNSLYYGPNWRIRIGNDRDSVPGSFLFEHKEVVYDTTTPTLLHFDGNVLDATTRLWINNGIDFSVLPSVFGSYCANFANANITTAATVGFDMGLDNFTIDFWYKSSDMGGWNPYILTTSTSVNIIARPNYHQIMWLPDGYGDSQDLLTSGSTNDGNWHHIALIRNGNNWYVAKDGALNSTRSRVDSLGSWGISTIGSIHLNCQIDEFRISRIARWTTFPFTVPAAPYSLSSTVVYVKKATLDTAALIKLDTASFLRGVHAPAFFGNLHGKSDSSTISDSSKAYDNRYLGLHAASDSTTQRTFDSLNVLKGMIVDTTWRVIKGTDKDGVADSYILMHLDYGNIWVEKTSVNW